MAFSGFSPEGLDLMIENRLQDDRDFYEAHKSEIKQLVQEPMKALCAQMADRMLAIDPLFVTVPSRMISRVRRDTRYTKDKTLYRANMWMFFRRPRGAHESMPFYYFEIGPESWGYGCWGCFEPAEMQMAREMILRGDALYQKARAATDSIPHMALGGERYKRPRVPNAPEQLQRWLNSKQLGIDFAETNNYQPAFDGSFYEQMMTDFEKLAPFYDFVSAIHDRIRAGARTGGGA